MNVVNRWFLQFVCFDYNLDFPAESFFVSFSQNRRALLSSPNTEAELLVGNHPFFFMTKRVKDA
jgi:hypothetical protein